jgi:hypothetical protein
VFFRNLVFSSQIFLLDIEVCDLSRKIFGFDCNRAEPLFQKLPVSSSSHLSFVPQKELDFLCFEYAQIPEHLLRVGKGRTMNQKK